MKKLHHIVPLLRLPAIVTLAFVMAWLVLYDFGELGSFVPADKAADFETGDFYQMVEQAGSVRTLCDDVVLVPIDGLSRREIASVIDEITLYDPKVIAIDLLWGFPQPETDSLLCDVLDSGILTVVPDTTAYIYNQVPELIEGHVELYTEGASNTVRLLADGESMAAKVARILRPGLSVGKIADNHGLIHYGHYDFHILKPGQLALHPEIIKGRAVFIGTLSDAADMHSTPVSAEMSGMLIHATSVATMIDSFHDVRNSPEWFDWLLAIVFCTLFVFLNLRSQSWRGGQLIMRVSQIALLLLIVTGGTFIYLHTGLSINFSRPLLMVGAAALAVDIWCGAEAFINHKSHKKSHKR